MDNNHQTGQPDSEPLVQEVPATSPSTPQEPQPQVMEQQIITPASPPGGESSQPKPKSRKGLFVGVLLVLLLLGTVGTAAAAYAIAYEKVVLPQKELQRQVSHFVMNLPFTPKTPAYVLEKAVLAHSVITSHSFDVSVATQSSDFVSTLGMSSFDLSATGAVDYSDPKMIIFSATVQAPGIVSAELRKPDSSLYVKVNEVPEAALVLMGMDSETVKEAFKDWVHYEHKTLDTPARQLVEESSTQSSITQKMNEEMLNWFARDEFKRNVTLASTTLDGEPVYKIALSLRGDDIDSLIEALNANADSVKDAVKYFTTETYIGRADYLVRRSTVNLQIEGGGSLGSAMGPFVSREAITFAAVANFGDYGQNVAVEKPAHSISIEEFFRRLFPDEGGIYGALLNPSNQFAQARDTQRRADLIAITNAIYQYAAENNGVLPGDGSFPTSATCIGRAAHCFDLGAFVIPNYIAIIPFDPSDGDDNDTGYFIYEDENRSVVAEAPHSENTDDIIRIIR